MTMNRTLRVAVPAAGSSSPRPIGRRACAALFLFAVFYVLFVSGYKFSTLDQSTQLTSVLHFFDNELYQKDFGMQFINPVSVKMLPHLALFLVSRALFLPVSLVYFIAYVVTTFLVFYLAYGITRALKGGGASGALVCVLLALFGKNRILESSSFNVMTSSLIPYFISVPFHLACFYLVLKKRYLASVVVSGALFYIHGQISLYTIVPVLSVVLFAERRPGKAAGYGLIYAALVFPMLVPLLPMFRSLVHAVPKYSIYELTLFRVPHHFFPDLLHSVVFFWIIVSIFLMLGFSGPACRRETAFWVYPLMAVYICGVVFVRFIPVDFVMLMYCLRVDVFLTIFFLILFSITLCDLLRRVIGKRWPQGQDRLRSAFMGVQVFFLIAAFVASPAPFHRLRGIAPSHNPLSGLYDYIRDNTPKRSLFITPPYVPGFRFYAERSIVVDMKSNPIGWGGAVQDEWMGRLRDVCHVTSFQKNIFSMKPECTEGYASLTREDFSGLCRKYQADYFVVPSSGENGPGGDAPVHEDAGMSLFRCPEE